MMMIQARRFKALCLVLMISFCTTSTNEMIVDSSTSTTSTLVEVKDSDELNPTTTTTTTIANQAVNTNFSKEKLSDLTLGDCFKTNEKDFYFSTTVIKVECSEQHTYEIVFYKQLDELLTMVIPPTTELIQLYVGQKCNDFKSLATVVEFVDPKYSDSWLIIQPLWDEYAYKANRLDSVICIAHLEDLNNEKRLDTTVFSISDDIDFYVYDTIWKEEHTFGLVCKPEQPAFYSTFLMFYAEEDVIVKNMTFIYSNSKHEIEIEIDLTDTIQYLDAAEEDIFYYFLKVSSLYTHSFLRGEIIEKELMDIIFESNEGAGGYFSYTNDKGETFESTCDMEDNLTS